jgi:hypothetical protein
VNLSESSLAQMLRRGNVYCATEAVTQGMHQLGLTDENRNLTPLGTATLAALSLPDAGEPVDDNGVDHREKRWFVGDSSVYVLSWGPDATEVRVSLPEDQDDEVVTDPLEWAAAILAAAALADQWRKERGGAQ